MGFGGRAQGKQAGSNGNQSAGQVQREPPPQWFPWGRSREVELWRACRSRCGLCRAGVGRQEGRRCALGRGRPRAECNNKPGAVGPPPPGGLLDSAGRCWGLLADFLLPTQHHQAWGQAFLRAPRLLSEVPGPVSWGQTPLPVTALKVPPQEPPPLAEDPVPNKVCLIQSLDGVSISSWTPSQGPPRAGSPAAPEGCPRESDEL